MQIGSDGMIAIQRGLWISPDAEETRLTGDSLAPLTVRVGRERELWIRLPGSRCLCLYDGDRQPANFDRVCARIELTHHCGCRQGCRRTIRRPL